jgi:peptidoglycan/xylan/chitin deacetylase (PgdA/CDA1 family)
MAAGACALTFDDGPDAVWTPRVLAELERSGVQATFFVLASRARGAPGLIAAMLERGHDVELHADRHLRHSTLSFEQIEQDTQQALRRLEGLGVTPRRWRTPWGICTADTRRVAARHGLQLVGWTIDTHDWRGYSSQTMLDRARSQLRGGDVILMHDAVGPGATRADCSATVELIGPLTAAARRRALEPLPLSAIATAAA